MSEQSYLSIYAKSFNWAGFFLPKQTYLKCSALYDFCRVADNIADSNETIDIKKIKFLDFQNNFNNQKFDDPIIKNMWQLINEFNISLKVVGEDPGQSRVRYTPPHGHGSTQYLRCQLQLSESSMMRGDSQSARLIIVRCYTALVPLSTRQTRS